MMEVNEEVDFREELENAMISCGCRNVGDISSKLLLNTPPMD